jgi:hypothetical protein
MFSHLGMLWGFCFECTPQPRERHDCNSAFRQPANRTEPTTARAAHAPPTYARSVRVRLLSARSLHITQPLPPIPCLQCHKLKYRQGVRAPISWTGTTPPSPHASRPSCPRCASALRARRGNRTASAERTMRTPPLSSATSGWSSDRTGGAARPAAAAPRTW